jgi:hypothetical protein
MMAPSALAQMICDPIENYDLDWEAYQAANGAGCDADDVLTAFMVERDAHFRQEAKPRRHRRAPACLDREDYCV